MQCSVNIRRFSEKVKVQDLYICPIRRNGTPFYVESIPLIPWDRSELDTIEYIEMETFLFPS